ncbi:hypothetical protein DsansV1_C36g0232031 [Dioscorea sansibarensis]
MDCRNCLWSEIEFLNCEITIFQLGVLCTWCLVFLRGISCTRTKIAFDVSHFVVLIYCDNLGRKQCFVGIVFRRSLIVPTVATSVFQRGMLFITRQDKA